MKAWEFEFFRRFLRTSAETMFEQGTISSEVCDERRSFADRADIREYAERLFSERKVEIPRLKVGFRLKKLREMNGREFNYIEAMPPPRRSRRERQCFVGHRFIPRVENTLRWNIRHVLEAYGIKPVWSGHDIRSVQLLPDIRNRISGAAFCIFDTRSTKGKPNVYVEVAMAYALGKKFILFEYTPGPRDHEGPEPMPSDLAASLSIRYRSYSRLFRDLGPRLPFFLASIIR